MGSIPSLSALLTSSLRKASVNIFGNWFRKKVKDNKDVGWKRVAEFSEKLREALNLTREEVAELALDGDEMRVGDYIITAQTRCTDKGWCNFLEARPAGVHPGIGYYDINGNPLGEVDMFNWYFVPKGTATQICPFDNVQDEILQLIESQ